MTTTLAASPQPTAVRPSGFDLGAYLEGFNVDALVRSAEYRRAVTRVDPLAFAMIYLPHHLRSEETGGQITFSEFHHDLVAQARRWVIADTEPAQHRDAYVAPRNCGKSTWLFLILPLWAAAHGHRKFIAAFADSAAQAEMHLASFKHELDTNKLLRLDFPTLCQPARRPTGTVKADRSSMLVTKAGFTFAAKGIDSASLGMKVDEKRPDLLILDDIEPDEANYSAYQKEKRERTLIDAILPLNVFARVVLVGTVTMPGSLIHDLVKTRTQPGDDPAEWVTSENFTCHYYPAILDNGDGTERSIWPDKWSLEYLNGIRHTRAFRKNMQNDPMAADGVYWNDDDFRYGLPEPLTGQLLSIDPAVTSKKKSDFTALAVVGFSAVKQQCVIRYARTFKVQPGEQLREIVLRTLEAFPETVGVVVESNQGGDTWRAILKDLPVKLSTVHQSIPKEIRAADLLNLYQRGRVFHEQRLPAAEEQMVSFPKGPNDDLVDAIGTGVAKFMGKKRTVSVTNVNYLGDD
jgi:phage terminase large subunit-like protein